MCSSDLLSSLEATSERRIQLSFEMFGVGTNSQRLAGILDSVPAGSVGMVEGGGANDEPITQIEDLAAIEIIEFAGFFNQRAGNGKYRILHQHGTDDSLKIVMDAV